MKFYLSAHKIKWASHSSNRVLRPRLRRGYAGQAGTLVLSLAKGQNVRLYASALTQVCHFVFQWLYLISPSSYLHTCEKAEYTETMATLSVISASHFAQDPRRLERLALASSAFKNSQYYKCVSRGFIEHPELGKQISWLKTITYGIGLTDKITSTPAYLDAIKIQVKCAQKIANLVNSSDT